MMGRRSGQIGMQIVDVEMMIPQNHLLRKIDRMVRFEFIYELQGKGRGRLRQQKSS